MPRCAVSVRWSGRANSCAAERERALATLLQYADGKQNAPYYAAAASGLGRTGDARAVEPLRRVAKYRKDPRVAEEARRALAVGFYDEDAQGRLRVTWTRTIRRP